MKFLKIESYKKGIIFSTLFNLFAKGLLFLLNLLIAAYFGSESRTDVYFYAYNAVVLISGFFTMLNSAVIIPEAMRIRVEESPERSEQFLNFFILLYFAVSLVISFMFLFDPVNAFDAISNFDERTLIENNDLLLLAVPLIFLMTFTGLLSDILISYRFFTITMVVSILNSILSISFLFFFKDMLSIASLLTGLLLGFSVSILLLMFLMKRYLEWKFSFGFLKVKKRIWKNIGFAQAGNITTVLNNYVPFYIFSGFSPGVITALTFAQQLSVLPNSLVTNHFTSVSAIKFNELYSSRDYNRLNEVFLSTANLLIFLLMPISGLIFLYSTEIITVVFEHGRFGERAVGYTSIFFKYLGLQLPLLAINNLFSRLLMAGHKIPQSFAYQIVFNVVLVTVLYFAIEEFGMVGYPFSLVAVFFLNVIVCYFLEKKIFNLIEYKNILKTFLSLIVVNVAIVIFLSILFQHLVVDNYVIKIFLGSALYLTILSALNHLLRLNDTVHTLVNKIIRK